MAKVAAHGFVFYVYVYVYVFVFVCVVVSSAHLGIAIVVGVHFFSLLSATEPLNALQLAPPCPCRASRRAVQRRLLSLSVLVLQVAQLARD